MESIGVFVTQARMTEIGKKIALQEYDVYLLEELWMKPDHATIKSFVPEGERVQNRDFLDTEDPFDVDPDADLDPTYPFAADPDPDFYLMRIRILIFI